MDELSDKELFERIAHLQRMLGEAMGEVKIRIAAAKIAAIIAEGKPRKTRDEK